MFKTKHNRTEVKLPAWFTDLVWQPLKALLVVGQTLLLMPLLRGALNKLWVFEVWSSRLLDILLGPLMLAGCLLSAFILWHHYDSIDDVTYCLFVKEPDPAPLWKRPKWLLSAALSGLGVGLPAAGYVRACLSLLPLPAALCGPLSVLAGLLLALGIRMLMIARLSSLWRDQRALDDGTTQYPPVWRQVVYSVVLLAAMILFIRLMIGYGILIIIGGTLWSVAVLLVTEGWPIALWIVGILLAVRVVLLFVRLHERRKYLKHLRSLDTCGMASVTVLGHPYLSLLLPVTFGLHVTDGTGQAYNVGVASTGYRRGNVIMCDHFILQYMHQLRFRIRPVSTAVGVVNPGSTEMGTWFTTHRIRCPEAGDLRSTDAKQSPVVTVMLIDPAPRHLWVRVGTTRVEVDNGIENYGYTVWTKNAFCRHLERQAAPKQNRYGHLDD